MPKVTIGIPVFNGERFIERAVRCFLEQDFQDLEVIVADNASADATLEICRAIASVDSRVTILTSDRNRGAAWNYNRLVEAATGEYFKWAAHDDWCTSDFVSATVAGLESQRDAVLCYTPRRTEDDTGNLSGRVDGHLPSLRSSNVRRRLRRLIWNLRGSNAMIFSLIRTDVLRSTGRIQNVSQPDRALLHELALHGPFLYIDAPTYIRYHGPNHATHYAEEHVPVRLRSWLWLDPDNASRPKLSFYRFLKANFAALNRVPGLSAWDYCDIGGELVIGTVVTRVRPKLWRVFVRDGLRVTLACRFGFAKNALDGGGVCLGGRRRAAGSGTANE